MASLSVRRIDDGVIEKLCVRAAEEYRVLAFDHDAASAYAALMARRRQIGRPMSILDGQIAAIARANRFAIATRNVRDFEECGLEVVNPFAG